MTEHRIMIVDDEPDIAALLEKALQMEGFSQISKVERGLDAVDECRRLAPDVVILDVMLPDLDGYEVCRRIRQFSLCPIMFLSSKNDEVDKILGLAVGGDDYVTKPFRVISRERLYEAVWGEDSFGCDNTVMVHIRHLREKLEEDPAKPQYIRTVKGLGYRMVNPHEA